MKIYVLSHESQPAVFEPLRVFTSLESAKAQVKGNWTFHPRYNEFSPNGEGWIISADDEGFNEYGIVELKLED